MPGRTISPNEAVTMILRAIGYTDNASVLVGQWPANYVSLGQSFLIYNNVSANTQLDKANAAQMIYNGLTVQLVQVDANSTVISLWDDQNSLTRQLPRTLLTAGLDCRYVGKKVISYEDARASKINLVPKVGAYGVLYKSNKDNEVVAVTEVETEFIAGKFAFASNGLPDTFKAIDGTEYNLSTQAKDMVNYLNRGIDPGVSGIYAGNLVSGSTSGAVYWSDFNYFVNGDDHPGFGLDVKDGKGQIAYPTSYPKRYLNNTARSSSDSVLKNADDSLYSVPSKLIVSAKVSGKTIIELRSVAVWDALLKGDTFLYAADQIDGKKFNGHEFPLDYNKELDEYGYALAGVNSLDDLAADNVVYIYKNQANKIARIEVGTETQSGVVTNYNPKDAESTVGGKVLGYAPYRGNSFSDVQVVNNEGTALLDLYGRIYDFQLGEASKGNFALIVNYGTDGFTVNSSPIVKLFDKEGKENTYNLTKDAKDDHWATSSADPEKHINYYKAFSDPDSSVTKSMRLPKLIEYKLSNSKLSSVSFGKYVENSEQFPINSEGSSKWATVNKSGTIIKIYKDPASSGQTREYLIDSGIVVFTVNNAGDYDLSSLGDITDSDLKHPLQYYVGSDHKVKALVVHEDDAGAQNVFVMISNITHQTDGTGGEVAQVHGLSFAKGVTATTETWLTNVKMGNGTNVAGLTTTLNKLRTDSRFAHNLDYPDAVPNYHWFEMVKFRIGDDGVLRADENSVSLLIGDSSGDRIDNGGMYAPNGNKFGVYFKAFGTGGKAGGNNAFYIDYATTPGGISQSNDFAVFDADAVYYSLNSSNVWTPGRVSSSTFNGNPADARYIFLKTDPEDFTFDVIIRVPNY
jgi:hypothetical protein